MNRTQPPATMAQFGHRLRNATVRHRRLTTTAAMLTALLPALTGCALELSNRQAAHELARQAQPPGSVYTGWRVFQDRCATCHAPDARGTAGGPDLLPRLQHLSSRQFVGLVLTRYDWSQPNAPHAAGNAASERQVDQALQRRAYALTMPAWQGEPRVQAHVVDLYAYLSARAAGTQGPGRPSR